MPIIFCSLADPPEPGICPSLCSGKRIQACLGSHAEIAGQRQLETGPEAITAISRDHRFAASCRCADVPRQIGNLFRRRGEESGNVSAAGEMLTFGAQHNDPDTAILIKLLESAPQLIPLRHADDVERRTIENDIRSLQRRIDDDVESVARAVTREFRTRSSGSKQISQNIGKNAAVLEIGEFVHRINSRE